MTKNSDSSGGRSWTLVEKSLAVLIALPTLATALLGLKTAQINQAKEQAQASVEIKDSDLSTLRKQYDQLKSQNDQLQADNAKLRSQLGIASPTANPQSPTVRHSGQIVFGTDDQSVDLDSPQSDSSWRTDKINAGELGYNGQSIVIGWPTAYLQSTVADYDTCRNRTDYRLRNIATTMASSGDSLCIKTSEKRYSTILIVQLVSSQAIFDVTTFDPPEG